MLNKILSFLLISFLLISAEIVTEVYHFNAPIVKGGFTYVEGCRPSMQGFAPAVSVKGCRILLPEKKQAKSVSVEYGKLIEVPGDFYIKPTIPAFNDKGSPVQLTSENIYKNAEARELLAKYYGKDALFPGISRSSAVYTGFKNGFGIAFAVIHPVQYNPVRSKLYYYDKITVSVETEQIGPARNVAARVLTPFTRSLLQFTVDNPEALANLELTPVDADDYEYLIITHTSVESAWNDFVDFNTRRGMRTKVVLINNVLQTSGIDNADKIRNFIKKEYEDNKIVFALLGGDINQIAYRELYSEFYDCEKEPDKFYQKYSGSDLYFGTLDGNWNDDGDGKYGEPGEEDLLWELYVGRIPVDNTSHLGNVTLKTLHYSETPKGDQVNNVLIAGEFLWDDYGKTIWGIDNMEYYIGYKEAYGWKTYGWPEPKFKISRISDKETGAAYGWDGPDLRAKILSTKPAWLDHDGHANTTFCFAMGSNQISSNFSNTGSNQNYFVAVSGGCNPGQFSVNDCFMETLLHIDKGAVALVSNWDSGFGDDNDNNSPSGVPVRHQHDALFNPEKRVHFLEAMNAVGKEALNDISVDPNAINIVPYYGILRYVSYNTNLLGDPALSIWTDTPKTLTATTFEPLATKSTFTMKTPPYTWVALADITSGEIFTTQLTGHKYNADVSFVVGDSSCSITGADYTTYTANNTKVKVIVKAHNYLPAEFDIDITGTGIINANIHSGLLKNFTIQSANNNTVINFTFEKNENVNLYLFNLKGVRVKTLANKKVNAGVNQRISISNNELSSGLYYCKINTNSLECVKSFVITK